MHILYNIKSLELIVIINLTRILHCYPSLKKDKTPTQNLPEKTPKPQPIWPLFCLAQGRAAFSHLRVREIVTRNGQILAAWPVSGHFHFLFCCFFSVFLWASDRKLPTRRHHHPSSIPPSALPLFHPIGFCRHVCPSPVSVEIVYGHGCLVGIRCGDFFQSVLLSPLPLGLIL